MSNPTIHVAIGNSDNQLTQQQWSAFVGEVDAAIREHADEVFGEWFSRSDDPWQNACWGFRLKAPGPRREWLRDRLTALRADYCQQSVAWNESETDLI